MRHMGKAVEKPFAQVPEGKRADQQRGHCQGIARDLDSLRGAQSGSSMTAEAAAAAAVMASSTMIREPLWTSQNTGATISSDSDLGLRGSGTQGASVVLEMFSPHFILTARTDPAPKEAGQPVAVPVERATPVFRGRRYESGSGKDLPQDLREQASSSSSAPRGRAKAVEPSEPIPFGGRSKDRRDYSPRLVTALDQIHDQGIELFLAGATERPYCFLELLLRDAKRRAGQDASSSESMDEAALLRAPRGDAGSWICYFCEQINGPALEDCSTLTRMGESVRGTADPCGAH